MSPERWEKVNELFHAALERESGERISFLQKACQGDEALFKEVKEVISAHEEANSFIEQPAAARLVPLLAQTSADLTAGQKFGNYEVQKKLAVGGMGVVYLAIDTRLGRRVALKILPELFTQDAERVRRFRQEARAISLLNHPNIVTIHEIGEEQGQEYIITEFVEGETLRERLRQGSLDFPETLKIASQIADALSAAHQAGIIHRDIKPENIMLRPDGYVKVLDFGLAKLTEKRRGGGETRRHGEEESAFIAASPLRPVPLSPLTTPGMIMGTVGYMSPEQAQGLAVNAQADIWSLGVMLYEMAAGYLPFEGATPSHFIVAILEQEPAPLKFSSPEFQRIVWTALQKDPARRYQTAAEMLLDLNHLKQNLDYMSNLKTISGESFTNQSVPPSVVASTETLEAKPAQEKASAKRGLVFISILAVVVMAGMAFVFSLWRGGNWSNAGLPNTTQGNSSPSPQIDAATLKKEAREILDNWTAAMMAHDLDELMNLYTDPLEVYQNENNILLKQVRDERRRLFEKYAEIKIELYKEKEVVSLESSEAAEITFELFYSYSHPDSVWGNVRKKFWLKRIEGRWRIVGEKDLQKF